MTTFSEAEVLAKEYYNSNLNPWTSIAADEEVWRDKVNSQRQKLDKTLSSFEKASEEEIERIKREGTGTSTLPAEKGDDVKYIQSQIQAVFDAGVKKLAAPRSEDLLQQVLEVFQNMNNRLANKYVTNDIKNALTTWVDAEVALAEEEIKGSSVNLSALQTNVQKAKRNFLELFRYLGESLSTLSQSAEQRLVGLKTRAAFQKLTLKEDIQGTKKAFTETESKLAQEVKIARDNLDSKIGRIKTIFNEIDKEERNERKTGHVLPCSSAEAASLDVGDQSWISKMPSRGEANFAFTIKDVFPNLVLDEVVVIENKCRREGPLELKKYQELVGKLLHPGLQKFAGYFLNHDVGTGKTLSAAAGLKTFHRFAGHPDYKVSRDVLILVPSEALANTWALELSRIGFKLTNQMRIASSRTRYYTARLDEELNDNTDQTSHIIIQVYTARMEGTVLTKLIKENKRPWEQFQKVPAGFKNDPSSFPTIYKDPASIDRANLYEFSLARTTKERFYLPKVGMTIVDEVHHLINPQELADVRLKKNALGWAWALKFGPVRMKKLLLSATPLVESTWGTSGLDVIKLLNLLKFPKEDRLPEGVWRLPHGGDEEEAEVLSNLITQENSFLEAHFQDPAKYSNLLKMYAGIVSTVTLRNDPSVYPRLSTICPTTTPCAASSPQVRGCLLRYSGDVKSPFQCEVLQEASTSHQRRLRDELQVIPVYIYADTTGKKKKASAMVSEIKSKLPVVLQLIKFYTKEKHFLFTDSKSYNDFWQHAQSVVNEAKVPYYDMLMLEEDISKILTLKIYAAEAAALVVDNPELDQEKRLNGLVEILLRARANQKCKEQEEEEEEEKGEDKKNKLKLSKCMVRALLLFLYPVNKTETTQILQKSTRIFNFMRSIEGRGKAQIQMEETGQEKAKMIANSVRVFLMKIMMQLFNHSNNDAGDIFSTFVADNSAREGLTLLLTSYVHIFRVPKSFTTLRQSIGRVSRFCSFEREPSASKWNIRVFLYLGGNPQTCHDSNAKTGDCQALEKLLNSKVDLNQQIHNFLKVIALDCVLFSLYSEAQGAKITCGNDSSKSKEEFRKAIGFSAGPQPSPSEERDYGGVCVILNKAAFRLVGPGEKCKEANAILLKFTAYNLLDAFIDYYCMKRLGYNDAQERERAKKDKALVLPTPPDTQSFNILWKYLSCDQFYATYEERKQQQPNGISFHEIYRDLETVSLPYINYWDDIIACKRRRTVFYNGPEETQALFNLARLFVELIRTQREANEGLKHVKRKLHEVPTTDILSLKSTPRKTEELLEQFSTPLAEAAIPEEEKERAEIRYIFSDYDFTKKGGEAVHPPAQQKSYIARDKFTPD